MNKILSVLKRYLPKNLLERILPAYHYFLSWFSALWYRHPSEKLIVIGVTGTTGKTTSTYLIAKTLESAGYKVGFTSTALFNDGKREWLNDKKMTMVGGFFNQRMMAKMVKNDCHYAIIETTSEGIRQFRHKFINYDSLIFTCLYPEHIESHGSFENYRLEKGKLFSHLKKCKTKYIDNKRKVIRVSSELKKLNLSRVKKTIIANGDDNWSGYFLDFWAEEKIVFTKKSKEKFQGKNYTVFDYGDIKIEPNGISFRADGTDLKLNLLGGFDSINVMCAFCVGAKERLSVRQIKNGLEKISGIPGRKELIKEGQPFMIIVDYAFEPQAVEKLYDIVGDMPHGKIIHVLGSAGGGRDVSRRPILGRIAGEKSDYIIVTNEDPYDDIPEIIIDQVAIGAEKTGKTLNKDLFKIPDRRQAIHKALILAQRGDIVMITGKGCEQAICLANGEKIPWDDRKVVREELASMKNKTVKVSNI